MKTKPKSKDLKIISMEYVEKLNVQQVNLKVTDPTLLNEAKKELIGKNAKQTSYGKGPFSYNGISTPSGSVFIGENQTTKGLAIVFHEKGIPKLEELIQSVNPIVQNSLCSKVVCATYSPIPENMESGGATSKNIQELRNLVSEFNSQGGKKKQVNFNERFKQIEIGSKGGKLLKISVEEVKTKQEKKETMLFYELTCVDCQSSNIFEASKLDPKPSIPTVGASQILELIAPFTSENPIVLSIKNICEGYDFGNVTLSKRERSSLVGLNSKVKYFQTGLNSCLNNFLVLDPVSQEQYAYCLQEFIWDLQNLSANEKQYQNLLVKMQEALSGAQVQQPVQRQYPRPRKSSSKPLPSQANLIAAQQPVQQQRSPSPTEKGGPNV